MFELMYAQGAWHPEDWYFTRKDKTKVSVIDALISGEAWLLLINYPKHYFGAKQSGWIVARSTLPLSEHANYVALGRFFWLKNKYNLRVYTEDSHHP